MLERLRQNLAKSNFGLLALELLIVIVGILIAFQIDRWAEERRDRALEYDYLVRLKDDLQSEIQRMNVALRQADSRIAAVLFLEDALANSSVVLERPSAIAFAIETATWRSFPQINGYIYSELQSTGNLSLLRSKPLRQDLADHYSAIRSADRVGLDRDIHRLFDRLTAGILSTRELQGIESESWENLSGIISAERANEIRQELARRQDATDLLPNIVQHHMFTKERMERTRRRTQDIIELIDRLMQDLNF
jgi:hypothetical protein